MSRKVEPPAGHLYTAVYDAMSNGLADAMRREDADNELANARAREEKYRGMVRLPQNEFYADSRFHRGTGGERGVMERLLDQRRDDEYACSVRACCSGAVAVIRCASCAKFDPRRPARVLASR